METAENIKEAALTGALSDRNKIKKAKEVLKEEYSLS